jgi:hypothetical protein
MSICKQRQQPTAPRWTLPTGARSESTERWRLPEVHAKCNGWVATKPFAGRFGVTIWFPRDW